MLPKKTRYAIKALVHLSKSYGVEYKSITDISNDENIPKKFLESILLDLRNNGVVASKMGPKGGYYLAKNPKKIMLSDIIRLTGGPLALLPCASLNFYEPCDECKDEDYCGFRSIIVDVRDATLRILSKKSIYDIISRENKLMKQL